MRSSRKQNSITFKVGRYLPIFIILLSLTIILGSTFAYFTDKVERTSDLTFSKVELSSETTTGINGRLKDVIPGTPLTNGALKFSKSIDSEAIYVRAKISFSLPSEYKTDEDMVVLLDMLRSATDFNIESGEQNGAVWSEKQGNYFYLMEAVDEGTPTNLKRVDTIDTYLLSNEVVVPRDLESLDNNAQYMKSINFHIAFEAIQADNVVSELAVTKETFNAIFPESEVEKNTIRVTFKGFDLKSNLDVQELEKGQILSELDIDIPLDANNEPMYVLDGWYIDSEFENKYEFDGAIEESITLYPLVYEVSQGLKFTYLSATDSYSVAKGTCTDAEIVVPSTYKGKPVTVVADYGFRNTNTLTRIFLPNTITKIDIYAFANCTNLALINLPTNITSIENHAFEKCTNLNLKQLPSGLTSIGEYTFTSCTNLALISLPTNIISIKKYAFYYCEKLNLTSLPKDVETIGEYAFYNCTNLALTELPNGLTNIGNHTFYGCTNLALTSLPAGLTSIGNSTFSGCTNLALTELPSGVTSIGDSAFSGCTNLALTELPSGVTSIGNSAFNGCANLFLTELPSNVMSIGNSAFNSCDKISLTKLSNSLVSIGDYAFWGCTSLALTELPSGLISIGKNAFYECVNIQLTSLPNEIQTIGQYAFYGCVNLALTELPSGLTVIENYAFYKCQSLAITSLPIGITSIGYHAFESCKSITLTELPSGVTSIGNSAFSGCTGIRLLKLPKLIVSIENYAFSNNSYLNYILCETQEVASLAQGKGRADSYIYTLQDVGYETGTAETEVVINDTLTIYTATIDGVKWVRNGEKYFKCIV